MKDNQGDCWYCSILKFEVRCWRPNAAQVFASVGKQHSHTNPNDGTINMEQ